MRILRVTAALVLISTLGAQNPAFDQPYRPQYHFSPQRNWTNDPNGLVYFEGEYHLFFQYNPFGDEWGHMSWGHALSRDLLHWQELPVAIPEANGVMIYTGSTVIDEQNTSGFCNKAPCMVAIYTGQNAKRGSQPGTETQNLAYSNDRGRTWTKYAGNPVLDLNMTDFRDPKVFWYEQTKHWVMAVALPNDHRVLIYTSPDLKHWTRSSEFGPAGATSGQWECPELFELPVEGKRGERRWILKVGLNPGALQGGSGEQYFVGRFDGARFTNDNPSSTTLWTDYGKDCYCALTFNHLPRAQKPVMIGWMNNWQYAAKLPTSPWRGQMTFPRELSLRETPAGLRLFQRPVEQLETLLDNSDKQQPDHAFVLAFSLNPRAGHEVGLKILADKEHFTAIGYDPAKQVLFVDRRHSGETSFSPDFPARVEAPLKARGEPISVRVLVDRCSVEVFADDGRVVSTNLVFPPAGANRIESFGGNVLTAIEPVKLTH